MRESVLWFLNLGQIGFFSYMVAYGGTPSRLAEWVLAVFLIALPLSAIAVLLKKSRPAGDLGSFQLLRLTIRAKLKRMARD